MGEDRAQGQSRDRRQSSKDRERHPDSYRVTIPQAAEVLGVKEDTIRKRIQRGTLESAKVYGRVHVHIPYEEYHKGKDKSQDASRDKSQDIPGLSQDANRALVETLREQVAYLQSVIATRDRELAQRAEEIRRRDTALEREQELAAMFANRLRELEAPSEPRESPVSSGPSTTTPQEPDEGTHGAAERPSEATEEKEPEGAAVPHGGGGIHITIPRPGRWWRRILGR